MAVDDGGKEEKFDFTDTGEVLEYISLEQARVLALEHARDHGDFYGPAYSDVTLVREDISQEEGEDYYEIRLSFRPSGRFRGDPGVEQFIIDKTGHVRVRQVLDEPTGPRPWVYSRPLLLRSVIGVIVLSLATGGVLYRAGAFGDGAEPNLGTPVPTASAFPTPFPTEAFLVTRPPPTLTSVSIDTAPLAPASTPGDVTPPVEHTLNHIPPEPEPTLPLSTLPPPVVIEVPEKPTSALEATFRGNLERTGVYDAPGAHQPAGLKWRFQTKGGVRSSPVAGDGVVYFGSDDHRLYAVAMDSGEAMWTFETEGPVWSSPSIAQGKVIFGSWDGGLYALDINSGRKLWRFDTQGEISSSPGIAGGVAYFGSGDNNFYAVEIETGQEKWRFRTARGVVSSPALSGGSAYFGSVDGYLYALDMKTGREQWRFRTGDRVTSSPALSDGVVYLGSDDGYLYSVDTSTGKERWRFETLNTVRSSPAIAGGVVYFASNDGYLYAVETDTGTENWRFKTEQAVESSPVVAGSRIYFGSADGFLYILDAQTGREQWRYQTSDPIYSSPSIHNGVIFFGSLDGYLYAVE